MDNGALNIDADLLALPVRQVIEISPQIVLLINLLIQISIHTPGQVIESRAIGGKTAGSNVETG